jgi:hypothetical protein
MAAQELRLLYRELTRDRAERRLLRWFTAVAEHEIPELIRLARTVDVWRGRAARYLDAGGSNGPTEAVNALIKKVNRVGHGYRNFGNYRLRLLLHCAVDWNTPPVTPIRGGYHASLRRATLGERVRRADRRSRGITPRFPVILVQAVRRQVRAQSGDQSASGAGVPRGRGAGWWGQARWRGV